MTTRHEFLAQLHELLRPKIYLEIGVQFGGSLSLAVYSDAAFGIDPKPYILATGNQAIFTMTSDRFFAERALIVPPSIDLAFIDGSHLFEDALADFMNIEQYCHERSVVVFDDMLPYSHGIAARTMPPGDWTGDVWKVAEILAEYREDLTLIPVDTWPTGTMVVLGMNQENPSLATHYKDLVASWSEEQPVPDHVLGRTGAWSANDALTLIKEHTQP